MGVETCHSNVFHPGIAFIVTPSMSVSTSTSRPLLASRSPFGTVTYNSTLWASSSGWSLHGHHRSAPCIWLQVAIQGAPLFVFDHTKPPSHGGRGASRGLPA